MKIHKPIIAHLNDSFFAGSHTFIYNYISRLRHFHPVCLSWKTENLIQFPFSKEDIYEISLNLNIPEGAYELLFRRCLKVSRQAEIGAGKKAERILKRRDAQLIHAHFGFNGYFALRMKQEMDIPLITNFYGCDVSSYPRKKKIRSNYQILFQEGDCFLVEGEYMKSLLVGLGCPEEKINLQRIAIPIDRIKFRSRGAKTREENVTLIFCGRLEEKKGLLYALKAVEVVRRKNNNFSFRIIGDGSQKEMIEKYIKAHNMSDYVRMLGFLTYDEYLEEMQKADIFIHPSITASNGDMEGGAPTTILEAQASGMPVVSSNHADIPNIVVPGKSALLSEEKDYENIAENIVYLLENQEIWEQMGSIGRDFVESYHDVENEVKALEDKYSLFVSSVI